MKLNLINQFCTVTPGIPEKDGTYLVVRRTYYGPRLHPLHYDHVLEATFKTDEKGKRTCTQPNVIGYFKAS